MRFFFVALAETKWLEDIINDAIRPWDERLWKARGVRVGILIRFSKWKGCCTPCRLADAYGVPLFVDNGAFSYLTVDDLESETLDWKRLVKWVSEYARWVSNWYTLVTVYALPDVPVHGRRFLPREARLKRIRLSAKLHALFARVLRGLEPRALSKALIVLQGYEVDEYRASLEATLGEMGSLAYETRSQATSGPFARVYGVGSVCVRKPSSAGKTALMADGAAAGTLHQFMRDFLDGEWPASFHFFGLHTDVVRRYWWHPRFHSSDTGAHGLNYRYKWRSFLGCRELDKHCYVRAVNDQLRRVLSPLLSRPLAEVVA